MQVLDQSLSLEHTVYFLFPHPGEEDLGCVTLLGQAAASLCSWTLGKRLPSQHSTTLLSQGPGLTSHAKGIL